MPALQKRKLARIPKRGKASFPPPKKAPPPRARKPRLEGFGENIFPNGGSLREASLPQDQPDKPENPLKN